LTSRTTERRRRDAVANRDRILQAARDILTTDGAASLNEIARQAGVGAGTLYRHFPTREALILAVYQRDVQRLCDAVEVMLARHAPLDAFRAWFDRLATYVRLKHGLGEALHTAEAQRIINDTTAPVTAAVATLLAACEADGSIRPDLDPADVLLVMGFMWRVGPGSAGVAQAARIRELVIEGMRPRPIQRTLSRR
jgi:AcrR family transcriptional regulator